jgi:hypothetical protein
MTNWKGAVVAGLIAAVLVSGLMTLVAQCRVREARRYGRAHFVRTFGGTNYVAALQETTVGRLETGYVLILHVRFENPNPFEVQLDRHWFVLVDHDKDFYLPSTEGTQTRWLTLPARGTLAKEMLSYTLPADALAGPVAVQLGRQYWTMVKDDGPVRAALRPGQFVSFQRCNW